MGQLGRSRILIPNWPGSVQPTAFFDRLGNRAYSTGCYVGFASFLGVNVGHAKCSSVSMKTFKHPDTEAIMMDILALHGNVSAWSEGLVWLSAHSTPSRPLGINQAHADGHVAWIPWMSCNRYYRPDYSQDRYTTWVFQGPRTRNGYEHFNAGGYNPYYSAWNQSPCPPDCPPPSTWVGLGASTSVTGTFTPK